MQRVVVIAGPTASGKSAGALALARARAITIINADAMQMYRDLRIVTARPDDAALAAAPHALYGVLDGDDACSAARWVGMARAAIADAARAGRLPVLVGGTGLYLKALMEGIADVPAVPADIRAATRARLDAMGHAAFHAELAARDPAAARLSINDTQRVLRAAEVLAATGRPLSAFHASTAKPDDLAFTTLLLIPDVATTDRAIARRSEAILDAGIAEARALLARDLPPDRPILKAVGVPELTRHIRGGISRNLALEQLVLATRRYAKRQRTWFRHQVQADRIWVAQFSESLGREMSTFIKESG